jgi:hypothetical protein
MILGMSTAAFTLLHVTISLIGIFSGFLVLFGMFRAKRFPGWTVLFLTTTILTSETGIFFHSASFGPPHVVGVISLVVLVVAVLALWGYRLAASWRWIYVVGTVVALYLNVFVGVVQAFQKLPFLHPLAPTQSEPPFFSTQLVVLALFVALGLVAVIKYRPGTLT